MLVLLAIGLAGYALWRLKLVIWGCSATAWIAPLLGLRLAAIPAHSHGERCQPGANPRELCPLTREHRPPWRARGLRGALP